ncbi:hypothetical protein [Tardiphaga sp. 367_B4_N1_1]|uniref:hypothetical protein n=1 Tax=Tardiphaga sp. 367_B4_N1_1 TaxID=3240777 RepID=UPI003F24799F
MSLISKHAGADALLGQAGAELSRIIAAREAAADGDPRQDGWIDRSFELIDLINATQSETNTGLLAKAQALIAQGPDSDTPSDLERLALSLANDVIRLLTERQAG